KNNFHNYNWFGLMVWIIIVGKHLFLKYFSFSVKKFSRKVILYFVSFLKCKDRTPFLVLLISTAAAELQHRKAIRESWASAAAVPGADIVRLFMLGSDPRGDKGDVLLRESEQYHDIIQQDFLDTYNNLTLKTLMGMSWVATYCSGTRFAMKTDSDVFVNTMHLIEKAPQASPASHRELFHRRRIPRKQIPPFLFRNWLRVFWRLAAKIVDASLMIKFIHLENVYVGFCLNAKGVEIAPSPKSLFNIHKVPFSPCAYNELITSHHIEPHEHILHWETLQEKKHTCQERKGRDCPSVPSTGEALPQILCPALSPPVQGRL
uniref:Hexosyltransferase n=1 Tax=Zonotrichia albicollis TaxID=44394 RepID=A0A8D2QIW6_ZONAL